jgi:hypothetical protein
MTGQTVRKITALTALAAFLWAQPFAEVVRSQTVECEYDRKNPSLESARRNFQFFEFRCAEQEIQDVLKSETLSLEEKANAHVLLAAVYFEMLQDDTRRRERIIEQFKEAFRSYRDWRGDLDVQSPEFRALMEEARQEVDAARAEPDEDEPEPPVVSRPPIERTDDSKGKKSNTLLYIGLGVSVGAAAMLLGGGANGGASSGGDDLPDFPAHPKR